MDTDEDRMPQKRRDEVENYQQQNNAKKAVDVVQMIAKLVVPQAPMPNSCDRGGAQQFLIQLGHFILRVIDDEENNEKPGDQPKSHVAINKHYNHLVPDVVASFQLRDQDEQGVDQVDEDEGSEIDQEHWAFADVDQNIF